MSSGLLPSPVQQDELPGDGQTNAVANLIGWHILNHYTLQYFQSQEKLLRHIKALVHPRQEQPDTIK